MKRGRAAEAIALWEGALLRNPGLTGARMNLAVAKYRAGDRAAAESALLSIIAFPNKMCPFLPPFRGSKRFAQANKVGKHHRRIQHAQPLHPMGLPSAPCRDAR